MPRKVILDVDPGIDDAALAMALFDPRLEVLAVTAAGGKLTRESVLAEVGRTKDFAGALGVWSFDANGDTTNRTMSVNTVKDGKFTTVKVVQ